MNVRMSVRAGVGFSKDKSSREAGREAAAAALQQAGVTACELALVFAGSKHDPEALREGFSSVLGAGARVLGGSAVGIITRDQLGYGGHEVGIAVLAGAGLQFELFLEEGLDRSEFDVGRALGRRIHGRRSPEASLLLLYDSIRGQPNRPLNMATPLLSGLEQELGGRWPPTVGCGLMGDMEFKASHHWLDQRVVRQAASALLIREGLRLDTAIIHGCKPASGYHVITKTDGATVLEIDGRPAIEMIDALLGEMLGPNRGMSWKDYPLYVTLGVNRGDKFGEFKEENYANRLCMALDRERGGLIMFEPDLRPGDEVQLMRRDLNFDYVRERAERLLASIGGRKAVLALYIDCIGRAGAYCGTDREEAEEIQKTVGSRMPLLGFYSGVEIADVAGRPRPLDWTGVLAVFSAA